MSISIAMNYQFTDIFGGSASLNDRVPLSLLNPSAKIEENEEFLTSQIITYLGNKRSLLDFIGNSLEVVQKKTGKDKLRIFDVFSGSGIVSRYFKQYASLLISNDLETYTKIINSCYLSNTFERDMVQLRGLFCDLKEKLEMADYSNDWVSGIIRGNYSPKDDNNIKAGERVFYTVRNAHYIDTARKIIAGYPEDVQAYFIAPLLALASVHTNTSGVFKGFYKNKEGVGQFGGRNKNALSRITADMDIQFPVFSKFDCETKVMQGDSNLIIDEIEEVDVAYIDPPYNQHPYGSNYFMLNIIAKNEEPKNKSTVSGIDAEWNRSAYNKAREASKSLEDLVSRIKAKYVLISFNSEGFMSTEDMKTMLKKYGKVTMSECEYNTFKASRNLQNRSKHVTEFLFLLNKK